MFNCLRFYSYIVYQNLLQKKSFYKIYYKKDGAVETKGSGDTIENPPPLLGTCQDNLSQYSL